MFPLPTVFDEAAYSLVHGSFNPIFSCFNKLKFSNYYVIKVVISKKTSMWLA